MVWPGLAEEGSKICTTLGLQDINKFKTKKEYILKAVFYNHYKDLKEQLGDSVQIEDRDDGVF